MSTPALPPEAWWHVAHLSHVIVPQNLPFPQQYFREKQCSLGAPTQKAAEGLLPAAGSKVRPKQRSSWHSWQQQPSPLSLSLHITCLRDRTQACRNWALSPFCSQTRWTTLHTSCLDCDLQDARDKNLSTPLLIYVYMTVPDPPLISECRF